MTHNLDATVFVYKEKKTGEIRCEYMEKARHLEEAENWDLDEENQDAEDALVASETFNLLDAIEDELLLSLPLSARHAPGDCKAEDMEKVSKKLKTGSGEIIIQKPNPFAILQKLKKQ